MASGFVAWYLFLGGLSGGISIAYFGLVFVSRVVCGGLSRALGRMRLVFLACALLALAIACVCLVVDLTVPEKAYLLFFRPTLSVLNVGALFLAGYGLVLLLLAVEAAGGVRLRRGVVASFEALAFVLGMCVVLYTGVFLCSVWTVGTWNSAFVVVLFFLSSLSCGFAAVMAACAAVRVDGRLSGMGRLLSAASVADVACVLLEAVALVALWATLGGASGSAAFETLSGGALSAPFWVGFVGCAILTPLILESAARAFPGAQAGMLAVSAASVLVGGYFLRHCMLFASVAYHASVVAGMGF